MNYPNGYLGETIEKSHEFLLKAAYLGDSEAKNLLAKEGIKATTQQEFISELVNIGNKRLKRDNFEDAKSIFSFLSINGSNDYEAIKVLAMCNYNIRSKL